MRHKTAFYLWWVSGVVVAHLRHREQLDLHALVHAAILRDAASLARPIQVDDVDLTDQKTKKTKKKKKNKKNEEDENEEEEKIIDDK
jgi:hypothetical protein